MESLSFYLKWLQLLKNRNILNELNFQYQNELKFKMHLHVWVGFFNILFFCEI